METDLVDIAKQLTQLRRSDMRNWLKKGKLLCEARKLLSEDATFARWCTQQKIAKRTAYKAMRAFKDFGAVPTPAQFSKEAMAILSQSAAAREKAITLSKRSAITSRIAREIVAEFNPTVSIPHSATQHSVPIRVSGGFVIVKTDEERPIGDLIGMLSLAVRELKAMMVAEEAA